MNKWEKVTLGDIASVITGPFGSQLHQSDYVDTGIALIMPKNIGDRTVNFDDIAYVTEQDANRLSRYLVQRDDIVYSRRGDVEKHAFITDELSGALCGTGCLRVRFTNKNIFPEYISLYLNRPETKTWIRQNVVGSSMPNLNTSILSNVPISYPSYAEQARIAKTLSFLDQKIALNKHISAELEAVMKTVYDYWFVQFDFPDVDGKPYRSSGGEMVFDKQLKRKVPKGWEYIPLNKRFAFERGVEVGAKNYSNGKKKGFVPFYRVSDVGSQSDTYVDPKLLNNKLLKFEDICVTFDGTVGKVDFGLVGGYSTGLRKIFDLEGELNNAVIFCIFKSGYAQTVINKYATGSNILHASESINHLYIAYNRKVYNNFRDVISPLFNKMLAVKKENLKLAAIRDWLLPVLMNGQAIVQ